MSNNIDNLVEINNYRIIKSNYKILYGKDIYDGFIAYNKESLYFLLHHSEGNKNIYVVYTNHMPLYKFSLLKKE